VITNIYEAFLECHINLALCLIRLAHFEDSISCLTSVLHYAPLCAQAYYLRGKAFICMSEYQIAMGDLQQARQLIQ
jgi:tetratricopeptide (TPR) repeat protein